MEPTALSRRVFLGRAYGLATLAATATSVACREYPGDVVRRSYG